MSETARGDATAVTYEGLRSDPEVREMLAAAIAARVRGELAAAQVVFLRGTA